MVQQLSQEPVRVRRHSSGECHPTVAANVEVEVLREEGSNQGPFPDIFLEGWGLIKTPDGIYLPETFKPFPHELEDLTDQWKLSERSEDN